jgi:hypothetical protein
MSSWINHTTKQKRVFKSTESILNNSHTSHNIAINNTIDNNIHNKYNNIYEHYYFNNNEGIQLIKNIKKFSQTTLHNVKKIVNVYQHCYKNNMYAAGFGDFIRGSIFLYQYCNISNISFEINMYHHKINSILDNDFKEINDKYLINIEKCEIQNYHPGNSNKNINTNNYIQVVNDINTYLSKCLVDENGTMYVFINAYPLFKISSNDILFIKTYLKYNDTFKDKFNNLKEKFNLNKDYSVIHIRNGDKYFNNAILPTKQYIEIIKKHISQYIYNKISNTYILIGDSKIIEDLIISEFPDMITFNKEKTHMGEGKNISDDNIIDNMLEFNIMSEANSIYSLSVYEHGSGFSKWCSEIFNISYKCVRIYDKI